MMLPTATAQARNNPPTELHLDYRIEWRNSVSNEGQSIEGAVNFADIDDLRGPEKNAFMNAQNHVLSTIKNRLNQELPNGLRGANVKAHLRVINGQPRTDKNEKSTLHCIDQYWHASISADTEESEDFFNDYDVNVTPLPAWSNWSKAIIAQSQEGFKSLADDLIIPLIFSSLAIG